MAKMLTFVESEYLVFISCTFEKLEKKYRIESDKGLEA